MTGLNEHATVDLRGSEPLTGIRRAPRIARSALFGVLFISAVMIMVLAASLGFSRDAERVALAYHLLLIDLSLIIVLGIYLAFRVWTNLFAPQRGQSAPLLHRRFVFIFSLAALTPAIVVGGFSLSLFSQNISGIFGENVQRNMEGARSILTSYVDQELIELGEDASELRGAITRSDNLLGSRISFTAELQRFARVRELDAIYVLRRDGFVLTRVESPDAPTFRVPAPAFFDGVDSSEVAFQKRADSNYLVAVSRMDDTTDSYLYVGQRLRSDNQVLSSISGIEAAAGEIDRFNANQAQMNRLFGLTFINTALLILMAAIWLGLALATRIIDPLARLINAAERVRAGDLSARVTVEGDWGEIGDLGSAFNRMTSQLDSQRDELVREHDLSEQRRQFSEAVLSGVRAGVVGLAQSGRITLINESARRLLGERADALVGQPIDTVLSEFAPAFAKARESILGTAEDQVTVPFEEGERIFDLRVSAYQGARNDTGWVLTFDDMTRLVSAQRHSAWREVARRIAHEIKNPLTPIQLSAERLSRKYAHEITSDRETFDSCTQTIIRQVGSLEQMVDEFSAFARMPTPVFAPVDLVELVRDVRFAQGVSFPDIRFETAGRWPKSKLVSGDDRLLAQALTNIVKNAAESVQRRVETAAARAPDGQIQIKLQTVRDQVELRIIDNGAGWPNKDKERLLEPYVTTRDSGTGLGLAIVKRIVEDHGGKLSLTNRTDGRKGAVVLIRVPVFTPLTQSPHPAESEAL